ncbi:verrucotoxin subunit beta-like isoform X2 [Colossoma macropomum]|uniref:verrucotoxin subunit beta-like isoform X2 n=1 Tax=Colossoma macropomum TaxID=42526 RepID=UPI001863DDD0|nr:verrucotoxin subunit beta-like isoform X2 [Colossoma macropomum]
MEFKKHKMFYKTLETDISTGGQSGEEMERKELKETDGTKGAGKDVRPIEIAALGRPLYPGMLYNCHTDTFIAGITLWDEKALRENLDVHQQPKTHLKFSASDSLSDKANLLDVSASLKASFMGGLVEVAGSAKYLHDSKSSARQERITMHYSQTIRFEQLTMAEFSKITYPEVFDQQTATHVITAVLYGAQAFMVFDHTAAHDEDKQEVKGNLHVLIKKMPSLSIEGDGDLKLNESEKKMAENISVTFHGDYKLEENPTTYSEALKVYNKLPNLLREEKDAVPVRVWLYPLKLLNDKAASLVREISEYVVSKIENLLEELGKVERRCNDLVTNRSVDDFLDLKSRLQMFQGSFSAHKIAFQQALSKVLPAIRNGTQEELALANILNAQYRSPFAANNLNQWLDDFTTELNILSSYISGLKDIRVVTSSRKLKAILFNPDVDVVVCLSFTSLKYKDTYLDALKDSEALVNLEQANTEAYSLQVAQPWFTSTEISKTMRQNLSLFTSFSNANKNKERIQFVIASISDPANPGSSIQLYEKGKLTDPKFQPVSKPPPPTVETQDMTVTLKLQKSPTGETLRFRVEYRMVKEGESNPGEDWETRDTPDAEKPFVLTGLQPGNQYLVRYKAVSAAGVSEASESVPTAITIESALVGGVEGQEDILTQDIDVTLKKISITLGDHTMDALCMTFSNNQEKTYGSAKGALSQAFIFEDGDRFRSLTLWPNQTRNRLGGLQFEVVRKTGGTLTFSAKIPDVGPPVSIDVGLGIFRGIKVRSGADVYALGFFFLK